jgi:hypothetical protein
LGRGDLKITYNAPAAGDIRYGVTNNTEARLALIFERWEADLMHHFHNISFFDYSFSYGGSWLPNYDNQSDSNSNYAFGVATTISKQWKIFNPYFGISNSWVSPNYNNSFFTSIGTDIDILKGRYSIYLQLTPELIWIPASSGAFGDPLFVGSFGAGLIWSPNKDK